MLVLITNIFTIKKLFLFIFLTSLTTAIIGQSKFKSGPVHSAKIQYTYNKVFKEFNGMAYSINTVSPYNYELHIKDMQTLQTKATIKKSDIRFIDFMELGESLYLIHYSGGKTPKEIMCTKLDENGFGKTKVLFTSDKPLTNYLSRATVMAHVGSSENKKHGFLSVIEFSVNLLAAAKSISGNMKTILFDESFEKVNSTIIDDIQILSMEDIKIDDTGLIYFITQLYNSKVRAFDEILLVKLNVVEKTWKTVSIYSVIGSKPNIFMEEDEIVVFGYSFIAPDRVPLYNGIIKYEFNFDLELNGETKYKIPSSNFRDLGLKSSGMYNLALMYVFKAETGEYIVVGEDNNNLQFTGSGYSGTSNSVSYLNKGVIVTALNSDEVEWSKTINKKQYMKFDVLNTDAGIFAKLVGTDLQIIYVDDKKNRENGPTDKYKNKTWLGEDLYRVTLSVESGDLKKDLILKLDELVENTKYKNLKKCGPINIAQSYMDEEGKLFLELMNNKSSALFSIE